MWPLPRDIDLATTLDVVFLGVILLGAVQFARTAMIDPGSTPRLLRLSAGAGVPATAPELGLLRPETMGAPGQAGTEPGWIVLGLGTLVVVTLGLYWYGRARAHR